MHFNATNWTQNGQLSQRWKFKFLVKIIWVKIKNAITLQFESYY